MLEIRNLSQLREDYELLPLVEKIVGCVADGSVIGSIQRCVVSQREGSALCAAPVWLVFSDLQQSGIAVNLQGLFYSQTNFRSRINAVQMARSIVEDLGGQPNCLLRLTDCEDYPSEWRLYKVFLSRGSILCAVSSPAPRINLNPTLHTRSLPRVKIALTSYIDWKGLVCVGERRLVRALRVQCYQQRFSGDLVLSLGGQMSIQSRGGDLSEAGSEISEGAKTGSALVRIDLGEIELSLQEIIALRAGTTLELKADLPLRCYMRVGATTLAEGELDIDGDNLVLCVKEVIG
jgi:hypothetical protein